jgi:hypothetical protein
MEIIKKTLRNTVDRTYRNCIWDTWSAAASGHQDTVETVVEDIKETIRAVQHELKTKSTQVNTWSLQAIRTSRIRTIVQGMSTMEGWGENQAY